MNQRLPPPSRRSQNLVSPARGCLVNPCRFTLQVYLRGQMGPACEIACAGLEDAIHFGQREFPAFAERNPWIGLDWLQRKIWIP